MHATVCKWILLHLNSKFVSIVDITDNSKINILHYEERTPSQDYIVSIIEELINLDKLQNSICKHKDCFYVPFFKLDVVDGFILIGPKERTVEYESNEQMYFNPIARILGKSLLNLEAGRINKEKKQLQSAFSRYVSPDVVDQIIENPDILHLGGEKQILSVIFTDLEGFTEMSDGMDPVLLVRVLNLYLNEMSEVIIALGGTIDKFEGDAIMAFFGAPSPIKDHAIRCCHAFFLHFLMVHSYKDGSSRVP